MSEPIPAPESTPPPVPVASRIRWHRVRVYLLSILLMLTMWTCGIVVEVRLHPKSFVDRALAQLPYPASAGDVTWVNRRTLKIRDLKLSDYFFTDSVTIVVSPEGLWNRHIAEVDLMGPQLFTKPLDDFMKQYGSGNQGWNWTIGKFTIQRGTLMLQDMAPDMPPIPIRMGVTRPVVVNNLKLNKPDNSYDMVRERVMEIENVNVVSPLDPLAPVLAFPLTRVRFTFTELWNHRIREVVLIRPTIYLGVDLFWFCDEFKKERAVAPDQGLSAPWEIGRFEAQYGQLAVNVFGQPKVQLPFFFKTEVDDIRLDQMDKINLKSAIPIIRLDQSYPDYKIRLVNLRGNLYFSLPPTDEHANNVVNTIAIDEFSWNDLPIKEISSTVTFDENGMYGKLNGKCYGGQLTGNFEIYYTNGFKWNADLFADKINSQPIAAKLGGKYIDLTGTLNGKLSIKGEATNILDCEGTLDLPHPGLLKIKSMENLMSRLPADAPQIKRDALKIAIDSLGSYSYLNGQVKIYYKPSGGVGSLKLDSPNGKRQFDLHWHPYEERSKVANAADNQ